LGHAVHWQVEKLRLFIVGEFDAALVKTAARHNPDSALFYLSLDCIS
jgi:hypothetical protein